MLNEVNIYVGALSYGLFRSPDGGTSWKRCGGDLARESRVWSLAVHPKEPHIIYAGAEDGIYRSDDQGTTFKRLESPMNSMDVWKVAIDPESPDTIFAGTRPAAFYRSKDGGQQWELLPAVLAEECPTIDIPRVTGMVVDPTDHRVVWAGIEVDGLQRSLDGGDSWTRVTDPTSIDIHDLVISTAGPKSVIATTPREAFASTDGGESWQGLGLPDYFSTSYYCHGLAVKADDPSVLFLGIGNAAAAESGGVYRSLDRGRTWRQMTLPVEPNSTVYSFTTNQEDPDLILACTHMGQIFGTPDGGDTWVKLRREFTQVYAVAWAPN